MGKRRAVPGLKAQEHSLFLGSEARTHRAAQNERGGHPARSRRASWCISGRAPASAANPATAAAPSPRPSPAALSQPGRRDERCWPRSARGCLGSGEPSHSSCTPGVFVPVGSPCPTGPAASPVCEVASTSPPWRCPVAGNAGARALIEAAGGP